MVKNKIKIIFEDGKEFQGSVFAESGDKLTELVFSTGMTGYQEILTDPSYTNQSVLMTYPLIGNYGINSEDFESRKIFLDAIIVKEYVDFPSNWQSSMSLKSYLEKYNVLGIEGVDTRAMTRYIRRKGACKALLTRTCTEENKLEYLEALKKSQVISGINSSKQISNEIDSTLKAKNGKFKVAVIDCGLKLNIVRKLNTFGCDSHIFSSAVHSGKILQNNFDGVVVSNGPGDPKALFELQILVKNLLGKIPVFGICLGHQVIGMALGASCYKLSFGHHGNNHPIKNLNTGRVEITSQNHNYALDPKSLPEGVEVTHINLNDQTVAGIKHENKFVFSVQYHPEAAPGPRDSSYLFSEFLKMIEDFKYKNEIARNYNQGKRINKNEIIIDRELEMT